jgi:hypothetical protein
MNHNKDIMSTLLSGASIQRINSQLQEREACLRRLKPRMKATTDEN